ncbi:hypothetical protein ACLB2K_037955 [Fragaria x ananassa]
MVGSQPTQDTGSALSMEQVLQQLAELTGQIQGLTTQTQGLTTQTQGLTTQSSVTQQSVADLTEQVKQDKGLLQATHDKLAMLGEDYGNLDAMKPRAWS